MPRPFISSVFIIVIGIFIWLGSAIFSGSEHLTSGTDRSSSGYQNLDFSSAFNDAVTRAETLLYEKNWQYSWLWKFKRILIAASALAGIIAAALIFIKDRSTSITQSNTVRAIGIVCGLIAAVSPSAIGYIDTESEAYLLKSKELKAAINDSLAQARANKDREPDIIIELNAVAAKNG